jgi:hypothetical protein
MSITTAEYLPIWTVHQKSPLRKLCPQFQSHSGTYSKELDVIAMLDSSGLCSGTSDLLTDLHGTLKVKTEGDQKDLLLRDCSSHMSTVFPLTIHSELRVNFPIHPPDFFVFLAIGGQMNVVTWFVSKSILLLVGF